MKPLSVSDVMHEVVFVHTDSETGQETAIASERLGRWAKRNFVRIVEVPVEQDFALYCINNRGIEQHRLDRLTDAALRDPVIFVEWGDGSHLLVDGHHRYVWAAMKNRQWLKARILKPHQWRPFVLHGMPRYGDKPISQFFSGIR